MAAAVIEMEVMPDHAYLLGEVDPRFGIHRLVRLLKGRCSRLLRQEFPRLRSRLPPPHVHFDYALGALSVGETTLTRQLLPALMEEMWCLADRNSYGIRLWQEAQATGASLLWRVKKSLILVREQVLFDGSYLSHLCSSSGPSAAAGPNLRGHARTLSGSMPKLAVLALAAGRFRMLWHHVPWGSPPLRGALPRGWPPHGNDGARGWWCRLP